MIYTKEAEVHVENAILSELKPGDTVLVKYPRWHDHCEYYKKHVCIEVYADYLIVDNYRHMYTPMLQDNKVEADLVYKYTTDEDMKYANERLLEILPRFQTIVKLGGTPWSDKECEHVFERSLRDIHVCWKCGLRRTMRE